MLYDSISVEEVVDAELAHEFLKEATRLATSEELEDTGRRLEAKSRIFQQLLAPEALESLDEAGLKNIMGMIFFLRRKATRLVEVNGMESLRREIAELLYGKLPVEQRFNRFTTEVKGFDPPVIVALAGEMLHYTQPDQYWLWSYWIYDPTTGGGALPLVVQKEVSFEGANHGEIYHRVGEAMQFVNASGHAEGFARMGRGLFGTHGFLACVYAVYMYTVFKMRLSKEFNRILPELPELTRRVLGVYKLEVN